MLTGVDWDWRAGSVCRRSSTCLLWCSVSLFSATWKTTGWRYVTSKSTLAAQTWRKNKNLTVFVIFCYFMGLLKIKWTVFEGSQGLRRSCSSSNVFRQQQDCLFCCMSSRLRKAADCYCVCLNERWTDLNGWTLCVYVWWKFVVIPFFCWKPEDPRTSPIRGRSNQTNTARSGGLFYFLWGILLSGCQQQVYSSPYLSWNNGPAGRTCPWKLVSQAPQCIWIWVEGKHCTHTAAPHYCFPSRCKNSRTLNKKYCAPQPLDSDLGLGDMTQFLCPNITHLISHTLQYTTFFHQIMSLSNLNN